MLKLSTEKGFKSQQGYDAEARVSIHEKAEIDAIDGASLSHQAFGELGMTPESKGLVSIFFGQKVIPTGYKRPAKTWQKRKNRSYQMTLWSISHGAEEYGQY